MLIIHIIIIVMVCCIALLPIICGRKKLYKSNSIKILAIILVLILMSANIVFTLLEHNEKKDLQSKIGHFNRKYSFDEIHPTSFGYGFYIPFKEFSFTEVLVTDDNIKSKDGILRSYKIYDVKRGGNTVGGTQYGGFDRDVFALESKITVMPDTYTIRSIQDGIFTILLEPNLIDKVIRVMFVVDNWVLIRQEVDPSKWEKISEITRLIGWENYGLDQKVFYRIKPEYTIHNKNNPWKIDLYK